MYETTIMYNGAGTTVISQEIYDLDNPIRKYPIKSCVLLEHGWCERRKIKIHYERENKEASQTMQLKNK